MALYDLSLNDLLDLAIHNAERMREDDYLERLMGLTGLQTVVHEITDRVRQKRLVAEPLPLEGVAEVIANAMWDSNDNRIGGPRIAAEAVEEYLKNKNETEN